MALIKSLFPFSFQSKTLKNLLITILIYIVLDVVCGLIVGLLGKIPLVGFLFSIVGWVLGLYFLVGIVLAILHFLGVLKE